MSIKISFFQLFLIFMHRKCYYIECLHLQPFSCISLILEKIPTYIECLPIAKTIDIHQYPESKETQNQIPTTQEESYKNFKRLPTFSQIGT